MSRSRAFVLVVSTVLCVAATARLLANPHAWFSVGVLLLVSAYMLQQAHAYLAQRPMRSHYGRKLPPDSEHLIERSFYFGLYALAMLAFVVIFINGTFLFSGKAL